MRGRDRAKMHHLFHCLHGYRVNGVGTLIPVTVLTAPTWHRRHSSVISVRAVDAVVLSISLIVNINRVGTLIPVKPGSHKRADGNE